MGSTPESWIASHRATIRSSHSIRTLVKEPASVWWVVELPML
jgi:hypothetical protein